MPYTQPSWATFARQKYNSLVPKLGNVSEAALNERDRTGIANVPLPGTIRRDLPDLTIPGASNAPTFSNKYGQAFSQAFGAAFSGGNNYVGSQFALKDNSSNFLNNAGATIGTVAKILEKFDPSQIVGIIKGSVKESADAARRLFGGSVLELESFITQPAYRKSILGQKLTDEEDRQLMQVIIPAIEASLRKSGYDDIEKQRRLTAIAADVFNVSSTAATVIPVVGEAGAAIKGIAGGGGKMLLSELAVAGGKEAVETAVKSGAPLIVDTTGNVFAKTTTADVVKGFLNSGWKDVLKFGDETVGAVLKSTYNQGLILQATQEMRKIIDPESAERIARDQRDFVESLSIPQRLALDLGLGLYLPLEIPGVAQTWRKITEGADLVARADIARAIDTSFVDAESKAILDRLAQFRDVETDLPLDIQLTGDLREHLATFMKERGIAPTVEHAREQLGVFANKIGDETVAAAIARDKTQGTLSHLSWYSDKLGRALKPDEQLMHWFITETEGRYIGDLGEDLVPRFEQALKLRTTGLPAGTERVYKVISSKVSDLKRISGNALRSGEASIVRQDIDVLESSKVELLAQLLDEGRKRGMEIVEVGGQFRIPNALMDVPEVKSLVNGIRELREELDSAVSIAKGLGIPDEIASLKNESELLQMYKAYKDVMGLKSMAAANMSARTDAFSIMPEKLVTKIQNFFRKEQSTEKILSGERSIAKQFREQILNSKVRGTLLPENATDEEVLNFVLSLPSRSASYERIPKPVQDLITTAERGVLKMSKVVSRFDEDLLQGVRNASFEPASEWVQSIVSETRKIEAQLPRGAFSPQFLSHASRWGAGITEIPKVDALTARIPDWAANVAKLQEANGVTKWITDYLVPHNPADIYIKSMNKLEAELERQAPGQVETILREVSKVQDKGISLIPVMPGGGPQWEALGKPMISGVQWGELDAIGRRFGVDNLGELSRKVFINAVSESGLKPALVDRLRAAPGIGQLYDALYRQYMLARFSLNPIFHLQQTPEAALIGALRSFNLPPEMAEKYLKSAITNPTRALSTEERELYDLLRGTDLFTKTAKTGAGISESKAGEEVLKATRWEENKKLHAFMAEFPVRVRGELFQMPALKNVDPLGLEEYGSRILGLQDNPSEIAKVIKSSTEASGFNLWDEAVKRAVRSTNKEVEKFTTYNLNRSALEKDLHAIFFPFSYGKKVWSELGGAVFGKNASIVTPFGTIAGGGVIKPVLFSDMLEGYENLNESPSVMQIKARFPTWVGWIMNLGPVNPDYPLINLDQGSIGFGGFRGSPEQAIFMDTVTGGKYSIGNGDAPLTKLGGYRFMRKELPNAWSEIFKQDTVEQQSKAKYMLNRLETEALQKQKAREQKP